MTQQGDTLLQEFLEAPTEARGARPQLAKIRYTHEDCVNCILANPGISQNELATRYGYSPAWMSVMINTDVFQGRLAARRSELIDPILQATLNERFKALTVRSLTVLQEKLERDSSMVPDRLALDAAALGAKALGLGGNAPQQVLVASEERIASLAHRLQALQGGLVVDVESREVH
jgi:hypothetical protein